MRTITKHTVEGDSANHQLEVHVMDEPGAGGANHRYEIRGHQIKTNPSAYRGERTDVAEVILFQNGPIKEAGVNGLTQEVLLAIVADRLESFQAGPFACKSNQIALDHVLLALDHLKDRTRARIARGVEGTHQK